MSGQAKRASSGRAGRMVRGTVTKVHPGRRTVDVHTDTDSQVVPELACGAAYLNVESGTAIDFCPEVGSDCYLFYPSDGTSPFIGSWVAPPKAGSTGKDGESEEDYLAGRPLLSPGDIALYNGKGAFVTLRKGGTVQVGASPIAQTMYFPLDNLIRQFYQNYEGRSLLGDIVWKHGKIKTDDGDTTACLHWGTKNLVENDFLTVNVRAGRVGDPEFGAQQQELFGNLKDKPFTKDLATEYITNKPRETTRLSICVDPENTGATYVFQIDSLGNIFQKITGSLHWEGRHAYAHLTKGFNIEFGALGALKGDEAGNLIVEAAQLLLAASSSLSIKSRSVCNIDAPQLKLGGVGAMEPLVKGNALMAYLSLLAVGAKCSPPPPSLLSDAVKTK